MTYEAWRITYQDPEQAARAAFAAAYELREQLAKEWQLHDDTKRQLAAKDEEISRLRTGDTCARACEGMAYRIEARNLKRQLAKLREAARPAIAAWDGTCAWHGPLKEALQEKQDEN